MKFLGALGASCVLLGLLLLRVTSCAPAFNPTLQSPLATPRAAVSVAPDCSAPGWEGAANTNASSLHALPWSPFGRQEVGWQTYAPLIAREIGVSCPPDSPAFAKALATWQARQGAAADGLVSQTGFVLLKGVVQSRRPFVMLSEQGVCARPADAARLAHSRPDEALGDKEILLRPGAFAAYRRMVKAARDEDPRIAADPDILKIFSGYRSPEYDAARCAAEGNCNGVERATCSPHRTGLALDLYVGHAPGFMADSSADANRLAMSETPAYRWLLTNAYRFGFVNYPFEPWHWEWTGEPPGRGR